MQKTKEEWIKFFSDNKKELMEYGIDDDVAAKAVLNILQNAADVRDDEIMPFRALFVWAVTYDGYDFWKTIEHKLIEKQLKLFVLKLKDKPLEWKNLEDVDDTMNWVRVYRTEQEALKAVKENLEDLYTKYEIVELIPKC